MHGQDRARPRPSPRTTDTATFDAEKVKLMIHMLLVPGVALYQNILPRRN